MSELEKRIKAFSTRPKHVKRLKLDDLLAAMAPLPKPPAISKADLRQQAEAAVAGFEGGITRLPTVIPDQRPARYEAQRSEKPARRRRSSGYDGGSK